jgi:peptidyl-prolyl cis-trans isomerase C
MFLKRFITLVLAVFIPLSGCGLLETQDEKTVITVGETEITLGELKKDVKRFASEMGVTNQSVESVMQPLIDRIVDHHLILEYGREKGIVLSDQELEAAVRSMEKDYSETDLRKILLQGYIDYDAWRKGLREHLLIRKIVTKATESMPPVSHTEIEAYYKSHPEEFQRPIMLKFRQIVTGDKEAAEKIWKQLQQGQDMAQLAREYSITPDAENGGEVGWISEENLEESMGKTIFSLPVGKVSPIVKTTYGYHIFKVLSKRPAGAESLPEAFTEIESKLYYEKESQFYQKWISGLRDIIPVKINKDLLKTLELE